MEMMEYSRCSKQNIAEILTADVRQDLHIHTCYSDGALTPQEVIDRWMSEGYKLIAITDHDGIDGSVIGMSYAAGKDITFISGVEFDSADERFTDVHILGYGFDYQCREIKAAMSWIKLSRGRRNDRLMDALNDLGYEITLDDIGDINEGRYIGKPTFALILYRKGYVADPQEAFTTVMRNPSIKRIRKETLKTPDVIDLIHTAGGIAVFAHPIEQRRRGESFEEFRPRLYELLEQMREYGVDGIECFHPSADEYQQKLLCDYAGKHDLLITRGSDFHRDSNPRDFSGYHMP